MTHHITDEQIDALLYTLNGIASSYNSNEYGLPLGCSDVKEQPHDKMRAAVRAALAAPAPQGEPFGYVAGSLTWGQRQSEKVIKLTRNAQPEHGFVHLLYTAPAPAEGAMVDLKTAIAGVAEFFDGEYYRIKSVVPRKQASGDRQDDECHPFDHCLIDQDGGGVTGDDFHGTVYFHIGDSEYMAVEY